MRYSPQRPPEAFPDVKKAGRGVFYALYKKEMEEAAASLAQGGEPPLLLLHSCCGPCSTAAISRLAQAFRVTVFYYNPNIDSATEYARRAEAQRKAIDAFNGTAGYFPVNYIEESYDSAPFYAAARGLEAEKEGGARCEMCFRLRLKRTAEKAKEMRACFFCTTLTVSPLKDSGAINRAGFDAGKAFGVRWLWSDFKKEAGYELSLRLSRELGLYRQDYCGCAFSKRVKANETRLEGIANAQ